MISLRISEQTEKKLKQVAKAKGLSQSEYLRKILIADLEKEKASQTPWSLGHGSFGKYGSGQANLSKNRKVILKEKLRAKKSRH